jgi:hypothetical protein
MRVRQKFTVMKVTDVGGPCGVPFRVVTLGNVLGGITFTVKHTEELGMFELGNHFTVTLERAI